MSAMRSMPRGVRNGTTPIPVKMRIASLVGIFGMNNIAGKSGKSEYQWTWFYCYCEGLMFNIACLINTMSRKGVDANYNPFTGHDYPIKKILESENLESL